MQEQLISQVRAATGESLDRIEAHSFIRDAHLCRLTQEQAVRWVMCAGRESRTFPSILEKMISKTDQPIVKLLSSVLWRPTLILAVSLLEEIEPGPRVQAS